MTPGALDWDAFVARRSSYIANIHASYRRRFAELGIAPDLRARTFRRPEAPPRRRATSSAPQHRADRHRRAPAAAGDCRAANSASTPTDSSSCAPCPRRVADRRQRLHRGRTRRRAARTRRRGQPVRAQPPPAALVRRRARRGAGGGDAGARHHPARSHANSLAAKQAREGYALHFADGESVGGFDSLIWATGREPNSADLGLDAAGVALDARGFIVTDEWQNTSAPNVYAVGDVTGRIALTPVAIAASRRLADRVFGGQTEARLDYDGIATVVFSHPPLGDGRPERGGGARAVRRRGDGVPLRASARCSRAGAARGKDADETGLRRRRRTRRRHPPVRRRRRRDRAGLRGRAEDGRAQGATSTPPWRSIRPRPRNSC